MVILKMCIRIKTKNDLIKHFRKMSIEVNWELMTLRQTYQEVQFVLKGSLHSAIHITYHNLMILTI